MGRLNIFLGLIFTENKNSGSSNMAGALPQKFQYDL